MSNVYIILYIYNAKYRIVIIRGKNAQQLQRLIDNWTACLACIIACSKRIKNDINNGCLIKDANESWIAVLKVRSSCNPLARPRPSERNHPPPGESLAYNINYILLEPCNYVYINIYFYLKYFSLRQNNRPYAEIQCNAGEIAHKNQAAS